MIEHSKEEAELLIDPHIEAIRSCVLESWDRWRASDHARHLHWKPVMGNDMCNYFLEIATHRFYNAGSGVYVQTEGSYVGLYVESALYLRFKKGNRRLRTSNVQTKSAKAFLDKSQSIQALEGLTRLELVYVPTRDALDIERVMLVCKDKGRIAWTIDLLARAEPEQNIIEMPPQPAPKGSPADRLIKPKDRSDERNRRTSGKAS